MITKNMDSLYLRIISSWMGQLPGSNNEDHSNKLKIVAKKLLSNQNRDIDWKQTSGLHVVIDNMYLSVGSQILSGC